MSYFNVQVVVHIYFCIIHLKTFIQIFLCVCNVYFIVPYHQQIIVYYKIYNRFYKFLDKHSCIIKNNVFEYQFSKMPNILIPSVRCLLQVIQTLDDLACLLFLSLHNKTLWFRHKDILFQVSIQESNLHIHLMKCPPFMCNQIQ